MPSIAIQIMAERDICRGIEGAKVNGEGSVVAVEVVSGVVVVVVVVVVAMVE